MIGTSVERYPARKLRWGERGGIYAFCPRERRILSQDEVRQMAVPPFRKLCTYCGAIVDFHVENPFG